MIITFARGLQELPGMNALRMELVVARGLVLALMDGWVTDHQPLSGKIPLSLRFRAEFLQKTHGSSFTLSWPLHPSHQAGLSTLHIKPASSFCLSLFLRTLMLR